MQTLLAELQNRDSLIKCTLSDTDYEFSKINIRPILIKENQYWQLEKFKNNQVFHSNILDNDLVAVLTELLPKFKQIKFDYVGFSNIFAFKKGKYCKTTIANNLKNSALTHNREKTTF